MKRQSLLPRVLSVAEGSAVCRKPFKPPCSNGYDDQNNQLAHRLWARKRFVPWGSSRPVLLPVASHLNIPRNTEKDVDEIVSLPPGIEPLVLWQSEELGDEAANRMQIVVDPLLVRFLRPHQRFESRVCNEFCFVMHSVDEHGIRHIDCQGEKVPNFFLSKHFSIQFFF